MHIETYIFLNYSLVLFFFVIVFFFFFLIFFFNYILLSHLFFFLKNTKVEAFVCNALCVVSYVRFEKVPIISVNYQATSIKCVETAMLCLFSVEANRMA